MNLRVLIYFFLILSLVAPPTGACSVFLEDYGVTGDGSDEGYEIESGLANATINAPCTVIFPASKTILFGNQLTSGNATIIDGNGSTLKMVNQWFNKSDGSGALRIGANNILYNLTFDGNRANVNTTIGSANINDIVLNTSVAFYNNVIRNTTAYGVNFYKKNNVVVRNNIFHDGNQYGISSGGDTNTYSENASIHDNTFSNYTNCAIKIKGCGNCSIENNTITLLDGSGFSTEGIRLYSADAPNKNIVINNNTISGDYMNVTGAGTGAAITSDNNQNPGSVISNNTINSSYTGISIKLDNGMIYNNTVGYSRYAGILILSNHSTIKSNRLTNSGVIISDWDKYPINNSIESNLIIGGNNYYRADGDGVYMRYGSRNNTVTSNAMSVDRYGVHIYDDNGEIYNATITNNTITAGTSCYLDEGENTAYSGNICNDATNPTAWSVSGLSCIALTSRVTCLWTNPAGSHNHTMIYLNGTFDRNVSNSTTSITFNSQPVPILITVSTRTANLTGYVNTTFQNASATTAALVSYASMNVSAAQETISGFRGMLI